MLNFIKNAVVKLLNNVVPVTMDKESVQQYAECRMEAIRQIVSEYTGTDVGDISLLCIDNQIPSDSYSAPVVATYACRVTNPLLAGGRYLEPGTPELVVVNVGLLESVAMPRNVWPIFIDSILAHELFHAVDARRNNTVFTKYIPNEDYDSLREQYTEWRAEKAVTGAFYPGRSNYAAVSALRNIVSIDNSRKFKLLENMWTATLEDLEAL